jgi:hypothetical protein
MLRLWYSAGFVFKWPACGASEAGETDMGEDRPKGEDWASPLEMMRPI